jgi:CRP-like cAMP-binding protein
LISGEVRVCFFAENGKQVHFDQLLPGTMFGELAAIDNKGRSSDCISVVDCQLAVLSEENFRLIYQQYASVLDAVLIRLAAMVRFNIRKVYEFSAFSVSQRVRFELLRLASEAPGSHPGPIKLSNVPTHAEFAARINTHREAVSRELSSLVAKGVISWGHTGHAIHDVVSLSDSSQD